jgi:hypothetical protein
VLGCVYMFMRHHLEGGVKGYGRLL